MFKVILLTLIILVPTLAFAEEDYKKFSTIISEQQILSQQIIKEALMVIMAIEKDNNKAKLHKNIISFNKIITDLAKGNKEEKIRVTKDPELKTQFNIINNYWIEYHSIAKELAEQGKIKVNKISNMIGLDNNILEELENTQEINYGKINNSAAKTLSMLLTKARLLSLKAAKEFLIFSYGVEEESSLNKLQATASSLDNIFSKLIDGDEELKIPPAPTSAIKNQLLEAKLLWEQHYKSFMENLSPKFKLSSAKLLQIDEVSQHLLEEINDLINLYESIGAI